MNRCIDKHHLYSKQVLVPCLPLHIFHSLFLYLFLSTQWFIFYSSLVYGSCWFILKIILAFSIPSFLKMKIESYILLYSPLKKLPSSFNTVLICCPHCTAASWCKEMIMVRSLGFSAEAQPNHTWHLSIITSSCCVTNRVKSKPSAPQCQPQAAHRIPVYPIPVTDFVPI